jgi:tetratricopeptide (TPR) repeat protein
MNGVSIAGIATQSVLLLFAGTAFLPSGRRWLAKLVAGPSWKGAPRLWLALAVLILVIALRFLLPDLVASYLNRKGDLAFSNKQFAAAALSYQQAVALKPSLTKARLSLAKAHFDLALEFDKSHQYENAIGEYERCILADDKNYAAHNNLARLLILQRKEYNEALRHLNYLLQDLAKLPVEFQYFFFKNLGWANLELHNYSQAEQQLQWALIKRNGAAAHYLLGRVFAEQGRKAEAKQQWDSFIRSMQNGAAADEQVESDWVAYAQEQLTKGG